MEAVELEDQVNIIPTFEYGWLEKLVAKIISCQAVPKHIAYIMDGNRRYSKKNNLSNKQGYIAGVKALKYILEGVVLLDVREISVFAFSIENFKRTKNEVDLLFNLAMSVAINLQEKESILKEIKLGFRFVGNLDLLPLRVQVLIGEVNQICATYEPRHFVNICLSYTARHELAAAADRVFSAQLGGQLKEHELSSSALEQCLYTQESTTPELLVRTSGEIRFSDFMLWQLNHSLLYFTNPNWPELTKKDLFKMILFYQLHVFIQNYGDIFQRWTKSPETEKSILQRIWTFVKQSVNIQFEKMRLGLIKQRQPPILEER